jgi:hypothetical protein
MGTASQDQQSEQPRVQRTIDADARPPKPQARDRSANAKGEFAMVVGDLEASRRD